MNPKPFKLKRQVVPERVIESQILTWLFYKKIKAWKNSSVGIYDAAKKIYRAPNKFHLNGTSDILGILPGGRFLAVEVKSAIGKPTIDQVKFIESVNSLGGLAMVARSFEEVEEKLKKEGIIT